MPYNIAGKNAALSGGLGNLITHAGIHTLTDPGTGTNANSGEATGGSPAYARQALAWNSAASGLRSNSGALTFDVPPGTYGYVTLYNDLTGNSGNYVGYMPINGSVYGFATVDTTLSNDQILSVAHGLADGDRVILYNVFSEVLATGLTEGTVYYVVSSATNSFKVSATLGGSAIDITSLAGGELFFQKIVPEVFASQGQITIAAGAIVLDATGI